jgi:hypothetical protein
MAKVTVEVEIDSRWVKLVRSPLYWVIAAPSAVSITFAPLFLYWYGKGKGFPGTEWIAVPLCFVTIYFVGLFNMRLGIPVAEALRKR